MDLTALLPVANRQHQVVTLDQARDLGISRSTWYRLLHDRQLVPLHPRVAALPGAPETRERAIVAAALAVGHGAVASTVTSAYLWVGDIPGVDPTDPIHLSTADRRCAVRLPGVVVHRPTDLHDLRRLRRRGVPTTPPLRCAVDLGVAAGPTTVAAVIDRFIVRRTLTYEGLVQAVSRHGRRGRTGVGVLREVLDGWSLTTRPPDSVLETAMAALLRDHRLSGFTFQHTVRTGDHQHRLDFAHVDALVDVEVDGWEHHGTTAAFLEDRRRDARLVADGWVVLRFTWYQVQHEPAWVAARIRETLVSRARR